MRWRDGEAEAVLHDGHLSVYAQPSMTRDDGVVAVGIAAPILAELIHAARSMRWNVMDGSDPQSPVIVEPESWNRLRRAARALDEKQGKS